MFATGAIVLLPFLAAPTPASAQALSPGARSSAVAKSDEVAMLRSQLLKLIGEVDALKNAEAALKAELAKKNFELGFRLTALELSAKKSDADLKNLQSVFSTHTHAMPNIGIIAPGALGTAGAIGVLYVPTSANLHVDLSKTSKPLTP